MNCDNVTMARLKIPDSAIRLGDKLVDLSKGESTNQSEIGHFIRDNPQVFNNGKLRDCMRSLLSSCLKIAELENVKPYKVSATQNWNGQNVPTSYEKASETESKQHEFKAGTPIILDEKEIFIPGTLTMNKILVSPYGEPRKLEFRTKPFIDGRRIESRQNKILLSRNYTEVVWDGVESDKLNTDMLPPVVLAVATIRRELLRRSEKQKVHFL